MLRLRLPLRVSFELPLLVPPQLLHRLHRPRHAKAALSVLASLQLSFPLPFLPI